MADSDETVHVSQKPRLQSVLILGSATGIEDNARGQPAGDLIPSPAHAIPRPQAAFPPPMKSARQDIWVFGYGSLMWRPNFPHRDFQPALLRGYHRALCVYSNRYRGTDECPGLVLGLDRGGSCRGRAMRVAGSDVDAVIAYLDRREMVNKVYTPRWLPVQLTKRLGQRLRLRRRPRPQTIHWQAPGHRNRAPGPPGPRQAGHLPGVPAQHGQTPGPTRHPPRAGAPGAGDGGSGQD